MKNVRRWTLFVLAFLLGSHPLAAWGGAARQEKIEDVVSAEAFEARAYVPSAKRRAGEVRLIRRGDRSVVEVLLYSKILSRVVAAIRKKETRNWPEGAPGYEDATRYIEAIEATQRRLWSRIPKGDPRADRRQKMWVDFVISPQEAVVRVGSFESLDEPSGIRVSSREVQYQLAVARDYARRNMRLIAADAFQLEGLDLERLLERLPEWAELKDVKDVKDVEDVKDMAPSRRQTAMPPTLNALP